MKRFWSSGERSPSSTMRWVTLASSPSGAARAILELELEAADAREAADRRRIEREDARARDRREPRPHVREDRVDATGPSRSRSSQGASVTKTEPKFGGKVPVSASKPPKRFMPITPGVSIRMRSTSRATSSVRSSEAPSGSWKLVMK